MDQKVELGSVEDSHVLWSRCEGTSVASAVCVRQRALSNSAELTPKYIRNQVRLESKYNTNR